MVTSQAFHFFGTAEYIEDQVADVNALRHQAGIAARPFIVWEPHAKSCRPDTLQAHCLACRSVDVFSPNHEELASFFDLPSAAGSARERIEKHAQAFLDSGIGPDGGGCMLVRAAGDGCLVLSRDAGAVWLPSFYKSDSHMVVDPTGAGNAFLGALVIGMQETGSYIEAAKYGQVAASFVIEQVGLPVRFGHAERELWNSSSVRQRLAEYQERILEGA